MNNNNNNKVLLAIRCIGWPAVACAAGLAACGGGSSLPAAVARPVVQISVDPAEAMVGQPASLTWSVPAAGARSYALECTGPGGKASASTLLAVLAPAAPAGANEVRITVDRGPTGETFNAPFASVTVCAPGTGNCRTVDRVPVDTGSVGLRLMADALDNATALPPVVDAANVPIQVISDPSAPYATIPSACRSSGFNRGTPQALGANGILGGAAAPDRRAVLGLLTRHPGARFSPDIEGRHHAKLPQRT